MTPIFESAFEFTVGGVWIKEKWKACSLHIHLILVLLNMGLVFLMVKIAHDNLNYYSFKIFPLFWLVKTTRKIHHKQLLLTKNSVILSQWRQPLTSKWRQKCSPLQIIESLTLKIIEPLTEKTWAQGCVIQQREIWPRAEFTSLSEDSILNE